MYLVYMDGEKIFDPRLEELSFISAVLNREVNSAGDFTFTIAPEHPFYDEFEPLSSTIEIYRDDEWLWQGRIIDYKATFNNCVTYYCEGALAYLNDSIQRQAEFNDITPMGYVQVLLDNHNKQVPENRQLKLGVVTVTDPNNSLYRYTNYNPTLQELKEDLIDDLGGYLRIRKFNNELYLDAISDYGHTNEQVIELGENLIELTKDFDFSDLASVIIPLGANDENATGEGILDMPVTIESVNKGVDYLVIPELVNKYSDIAQVVKWSNVHTPEILKTKAEKYIKDQRFGEMVIECKAFDLNYTDSDFERFELGDKVRVISKPHALDRFFPITKQSIDLINIVNNTLTLGGHGNMPTITGVAGKVTIQSGKILEQIKEPNKLIDQAVHKATELINQGLLNGHVVITENEILIMDTDDIETATNVWRWNSGGLGYSKNGYNGPFETAITMDGTIAGKFLAANSVAAEQLDVTYRTKIEKQLSDANDYTDEKLKDYWTIKETQTQFKTTSDSILSSVSSTYVTRTDYGKLETRVQSTEQKITEDGIFTTINSGLKGSKSFTTTKFTMDKNGLTIQGGGLTIKNNSGTDVLYADTYGNITVRGNIIHYNSNGYRAIEIKSNLINVYAWYTNGDYVGSLGSVHLNNTNNSAIGLWCDYEDSIQFSYTPQNFNPDNASNYNLTTIMRLSKDGVDYIKGTLDGSYGAGADTFTVSNGLITNWSSGRGLTGDIHFGPHTLTFTRGSLTSASYGSTSTGTLYIGPGTVSVERGVITGWDYGTMVSGTYTVGNRSLTFQYGVLTSIS